MIELSSSGSWMVKLTKYTCNVLIYTPPHVECWGDIITDWYWYLTYINYLLEIPTSQPAHHEKAWTFRVDFRGGLSEVIHASLRLSTLFKCIWFVICSYFLSLSRVSYVLCLMLYALCLLSRSIFHIIKYYTIHTYSITPSFHVYLK